MTGCEKFKNNEKTMKDILVVQRQSQTIRAMSPQSGDEKWNFSVALHSLQLRPGMENPCDEVGEEDEDEMEEKVTLKAVVPDGIICAMKNNEPSSVKWKKKFQSPIVNAWRIVDKKIVEVFYINFYFY